MRRPCFLAYIKFLHLTGRPHRRLTHKQFLALTHRFEPFNSSSAVPQTKETRTNAEAILCILRAAPRLHLIE